jgi:hypothetical protein
MRRLGGGVFSVVGFDAAGFAGVIERGSLQRHQGSGFELHPAVASGCWMAWFWPILRSNTLRSKHGVSSEAGAPLS